jgi:O-antigen ligase
LCFWRTGAQNTYQVVRKFCLFAIFANFAYWVLLPRYAIMTGVLAGSLRGLFIHKNFFAQFMAEALIFVVPAAASLRRFDRIAILCSLATMLDLAMIAKSHSATAVLLLALAGAAWLSLRVLSRIRFRLARALMLAWVAFLGLVVYLAFADGLMDAITSALGKDPTLTGRTKLWQVLYQISLQRPWTGAGFGVYRLPSVMAELAPYFGWQARSTHNTYLELVLTIGYPTTILFCGLLLVAILRKIMVMNPRDNWEVRGVLLILVVLAGAGAEAGWLLATMSSWPLLLTMLQRPVTAGATRTARQPVAKRQAIYPLRRYPLTG